jgi:hypothetical protein
MKFTRPITRAVKGAVRAATHARHRIEVGEFYDSKKHSVNLLLMEDDNDLFQTHLLDDINRCSIQETGDGLVALDCYLYNRDGYSGNCYVLLDLTGKVYAATTDYNTYRVRLRQAQQFRRARAACALDPDAPLGVVADWLGDHELYDLERAVREELKRDQ